MEINNPAHRLFTLLTELKGFYNPNKSVSHVISEVVGVPNTPSDVMYALIEMHNLWRDVVLQVSTNSSMPAASVTKYGPQIVSALAITNLEAPWVNFRDRITQDCLVVLDIAANFEGLAQDAQPSDEVISALRTDLDDLFEFVSSAKLDSDFRKFVLEQIEQVRRCLAEYRISGAQGFARYLESLIGKTVRYAPIMRREAVENPEAISKFKKVVNGVAKFVALTKDGIKFLNEVKETCADGAVLLQDLSGPSGSEIPEIN